MKQLDTSSELLGKYSRPAALGVAKYAQLRETLAARHPRRALEAR